MPREKLSDKQQRILAYIREFLEEHGYPPTVRDIQSGCDISSTSVVDYNLRLLQRYGYLRRSPEVSRGIELLAGRERARPLVAVPVLGYIAAGQPVPVPSDESWAGQVTESVELPTSLVGQGERVYGLRVRGLSMIDALIGDGDIVLLRPAAEVRQGDMVVAWLKEEKEATLKRFFREGDRVRLQPANTQMEPIYTKARNLEIQGKVIGVIRLLQ